jgi:hypothetical protein
LTSYTYLLRAKAFYAKLQAQDQLDLESKVFINSNQAQMGYEELRCDDGIKQALSLKMLLCNKLGRIAERDDFASQLINIQA